jgi:hypothetical protein
LILAQAKRNELAVTAAVVVVASIVFAIQSRLKKKP